ncbi:metallophosphoesterase family protein [Hespellia stercorisuis]|uniref:Calcineurin-like phosphoesterase n=1 Tax=Hespellia stercorisuis DSM 15480 TaxID=1121950 RepID=A0A1M6QHB2_9FIRM|nr:metallophosphoesterase [Hespellia stercorisuis]SHK19704.1 Calcineurin-like phosphoesterase [Hespellia stercorisuis DSM 15480]
MKFIHIADVHLGAAPEAGKSYSETRGQELWDSLGRVIDRCEDEQTDLLLIAGDMFHRQPLLRELKEANFLFSKLSHTKVVFIVGNHDYLKADSYYRTFTWNENVYPLLDRRLDCVEFPELDTAVFGFSYDAREITEPLYDDVTAPREHGVEILLAHGGDEKHIPLNKEKLKNSGFDYIALGHIHKPQILLPDKAMFAGALEPLDKNDTGMHGIVAGTFTDTEMSLEFIPTAMREYIHLQVMVDESMTSGALKARVKAEIESHGTGNIYKVILRGFRDPDILFDLDSMDAYGNIIEMADETKPAYDYEKLMEQNADNLLGKFIAKFMGSDEDSVEYQALYEGVQALLEER